jgi:outer membrane protein OmpA-like peptidoglycan-associated protein
MNRLSTASASIALAGSILLSAAPSFAQTVGSCPSAGSSATSQPVWVMFDLGSSVVRASDKPAISQAVATAKARQAVKVCIVGQTDKLGDKALNERLARSRSQAVAAEMIKAGYPADKIVIATNPEAFGNLSVGSRDAQEKDRRVTIVFR